MDINIILGYFEKYAPVCLIILYIISFICQIVAGRVKSSKLQKMFSLLPDAMSKAEREGHTADEKLKIALNYIKERCKISTSTIVENIERCIELSKNVNVQTKSKSESRIT